MYTNKEYFAIGPTFEELTEEELMAADGEVSPIFSIISKLVCSGALSFIGSGLTVMFTH